MAKLTLRSSRLGLALVLATGLASLGGVFTTKARAQLPGKATVAITDSGASEVIRAINEKLAEGWKANKLKPSDRCSDYEFIRRASLDIIGRIAKVEEISRFMKDPPQTRRKLLIDRLLADEEFADNWANQWTVWLLTRSGALDENRRVYHEQMHYWLKKQFEQPSASWKEIVTKLLTASGKTNEEQAVNFILAHLGETTPAGKESEEGHYEMVPITSRVTRLFLGRQTQCTQCHDHPFNPEFKQQQFWGINAFFRQVKRVGVPAMQRNVKASILELQDDASVNRDGSVFYERRNGVLLSTRASFFEEGKFDSSNTGANRRQQLAEFVTKSEYFNKAYVNRVWAHFFGRGFTSPVDDFGEHNPVSNPELLKFLGDKFEHYGYKPHELVRWICNSDAYGLSSVANKTNEKADAEPFFARMLLKAMSPEQLFDSLLVATQADKAESKTKRDEWMRRLNNNFGDDEGNELSFNGTVVQALLMMNGKDINEAISYDKKGTVALTVKRAPNAGACLNELYLAALNRPPTPQESAKIQGILKTAPTKGRTNPLSPWQDLFWALLNSNEFILNH